ncbi:MAG: Bifunctional deaminase-reductase domain protein [Parcubacteria group bacterium GW2011_GWA2_49_9]|nr:MAG: Bifunctional deaminase-reductase domain protein [Parcubacteria group bacterium GW2011_GWA2_49_9]
MAKNTRKPHFILYAAVSLDGMITNGEKEGSEWTSTEDKRFFHRELNASDVAIMGRKTFEAIKRPLKPRNRIVFSRRGFSLSKGSTAVFGRRGVLLLKNPTVRRLYSLLSHHNWTRIAVVGGTSIYDWFLKRNLVHEIYLTVEPLTFGTGKPLALDGLKRFSKFELVSVKRLNATGTLLLHYARRTSNTHDSHLSLAKAI